MATANQNEGKSRASSYLKLTKEIQFDKAVMFVGAVGAGKSTLCNFLMKRQIFEAAGGPFAVTREAQCEILPFGGQRYMIVDCPGFLETKKENEEKVLGELCRAGVMARNGVDAIALIINITERFSEKKYEQAIHILDTLGANFWDYMFIIFTHEDEMKAKASSSEEYIQAVMNDPDCSSLLIQIYYQVNSRYMSIESKKPTSDTQYWEGKCRELVGHMNFISEMNENKRYESVLMSRGREFYLKFVDLNANNQKLQEEISEIKNFMKEEVEKRKELEKKWKELEDTNKKMAKGVADYERSVKEKTNGMYGMGLVGVVGGVLGFVARALI